MEKKSIEQQIREMLEKNTISVHKMQEAFNEVKAQLLKEGKGTLDEEEWQRYERFKAEGCTELEKDPLMFVTWTYSFAYGIQTMLAMFSDVDFSKPFRVEVDYDPEQPRTIVRTYLTKEAREARESYIASILEKGQD